MSLCVHQEVGSIAIIHLQQSGQYLAEMAKFTTIVEVKWAKETLQQRHPAILNVGKRRKLFRGMFKTYKVILLVEQTGSLNIGIYLLSEVH